MDIELERAVENRQRERSAGERPKLRRARRKPRCNTQLEAKLAPVWPLSTLVLQLVPAARVEHEIAQCARASATAPAATTAERARLAAGGRSASRACFAGGVISDRRGSLTRAENCADAPRPTRRAAAINYRRCRALGRFFRAPPRPRGARGAPAAGQPRDAHAAPRGRGAAAQRAQGGGGRLGRRRRRRRRRRRQQRAVAAPRRRLGRRRRRPPRRPPPRARPASAEQGDVEAVRARRLRECDRLHSALAPVQRGLARWGDELSSAAAGTARLEQALSEVLAFSDADVRSELLQQEGEDGGDVVR